MENPLDFIWLDLLAGTFTFDPMDEDDSLENERAAETISVLRLNREPLRKARENAFGGYRDRFMQIIDRFASGAANDEIVSREKDLARSPHRAVWLEMKRQRDMIPELGAMFDAYPAALAL